MLHSFTRCAVRPTRLARHLAATALVLSVAAPASAQLFRASPSSGASWTLDVQGAGATLGTDVAYDPVNNVFLVVGGFGSISGQFVSVIGVPLGPAFTIMNGTSYFGHLPRATFSPDANLGQGGFLITWHENSAGPISNEVHGLVVAYPAGVVSADQTISSAVDGLTYWNAAAPSAYSLTSRRFLVVWQTVNYGIQGRFVDPNGVPFGSVMPIENPGGSRSPATAWNAVSDEFGISYCAWGGANAWAVFRRLPASGGLPSPRSSFGFTTGTYISDIAYNSATTNFVMTWSTMADVQAAAFDVGGNLLGSGLVSIFLNHSVDNLGLSFNPFSRTFLVVGHSGALDDLGVELNSNGAPDSSYAVITSGATRGSYFPRPAANATVGQWAVSFSMNLSVAADQIVGTTSTDGGSSDPLGTPYTGGGGGASAVCTTPDPFAAIGGGTCVNGGWVPSGSTSTGGTTPCTTPDPFAAIGGGTCVNGGWVPPSSTGTTTSTCATAQPAAGWTCVNGGWVPPASTGTTTTSTCTTVQPAAGWTCVNGGWTPPSSTGATTTGTCTTPDPFAAIGGGTCVNGGWVPKVGQP